MTLEQFKQLAQELGCEVIKEGNKYYLEYDYNKVYCDYENEKLYMTHKGWSNEILKNKIKEIKGE